MACPSPKTTPIKPARCFANYNEEMASSSDSSPTQSPSRKFSRKARKSPDNKDNTVAENRASKGATSGADGTSDAVATPDVDLMLESLDDHVDYQFKKGEAVWVLTGDEQWVRGTVGGGKTRLDRTRRKEGVWYPVMLGPKIRQFFAPLNGTIKPDTQEVRQLLEEGGFLP